MPRSAFARPYHVLALGAALIAAAVLQGAAASAAHAFTVLPPSDSVSTSSSLSTRSHEAFCSGSGTPTAVGGELLASDGTSPEQSGEVYLMGLEPSSVNGGLVSAAEDSSYSPSWRIRSQVLCATGQTVEVRRANSPNNTAATKTAVAICPAGMSALAGGFHVNGTTNRAFVRSMLPNVDRVTVVAEAFGPLQTSWSVTAVAFCADADVTLVGGPVRTGTADVKVSTATCTSGHVHGMGFVSTGGFGVVNLSALVAGPTSVTARMQETQSRSGGDWAMSSYAICGR